MQGFLAWNEVEKRGEEEEEEEEEDDDEEGNVEGLVRKSNGFLPMNFSNPKRESFDAEGISCGERERSKVAGLKEKLAGGFSQGITLDFSTQLIRLGIWLVLPVDNPHPRRVSCTWVSW